MRTIIAAAIFTLILAAFCSPLAAQTAHPTFVFLLEAKGVPNGTIHVFSLDSTTGAITEVPGSPFNAGLIPEQLVADPTGRFVYVTNNHSQDITGLSVNASTGGLTELPGSPFPIGAPPVTSAVDPTGRFLYVFAISVVNNVQEEFLYEYAIDSATGVLTAASSSPTTWEFGPGILITSIAFNPAGNYAYLGQVAGNNGGAPTLVCSVDFSSGTLTQIGSVQPATTGEASHVAVSPSGSFLYSVNTNFSQVDAFTVGSGGAGLSEISGSPYSVPYGPSSLVVHPAGNFLYTTNSNSTFLAPPTSGPIDGSIYAFSIDSGTGALTQVSGSPFTTGIDPQSIVVDPTGSFAYWTSTSNTTGTPFAQIMGYSINALSGVLTPLSWTPWTDSVTSNGDQLVMSFVRSTTPNPVPMISSLSPPSTIATAVGFTLQVNGANFVPGATVYFGGQPRSTTFVNSTQLNASILGSDIDNGGTALVFVFNPLPGGGASTSVEFPVSAPFPNISAISPSSVNAGGPLFTLVVAGSNFVTSSFVNFNGTALTTVYSSPALVLVQISNDKIVTTGTATISVTSPSNGVSGGGTSNTVTLTILPAVAPFAVSSISPTSATAGGPAFTLTVNGSGFVQGAQISFNLNNVITTFVNSTQLTAIIPASAIAIAGNPYVIVTNPDGSTSAALTFTVNNPQPIGGSVFAGSNALTLNVTGTGFVPSSVVLVNGTPRVTTYKSSTLLVATLLPSDLSQSGTLNITVMNPPPGGGTSAVIGFTFADFSVTAPNSPTSVTAGHTANFALTVSSSRGAFSNPVMLGVSPLTPLPIGATASFAPSSPVTPGDTPQPVTLSITTTPRTSTSTINFPGGSRPVLPLLWLIGMGFTMAGFPLRASGGRLLRLAPQLRLALLMVAAAGLVACGAVGAGSPNTSSPTPINMAGNWFFSVKSSSVGGQRTFPGTIAQNGPNISASWNTPGNSCAQTVTLAGTLNANSITASLNGNGQIISVTGTISTDGNSASGSYSDPGGCTNADTGTWSGTRSGTGSGTGSNPNGTPAGTYPIIVTATSGGVSHTATVTLTVM